MTTRHEGALKILEPMHKNFDSYMFKPVLNGTILEDNVPCNVFYIHNHTYEKGFEYDASEWIIMNDDGNMWHTRKLQSKNFMQKFNNIFHHYLPTMTQLWEQILRFNDEQENITVHHSMLNKEFILYTTDNELKTTLDRFTYTDADSMYLALLKVCLQIWKIKQEA